MAFLYSLSDPTVRNENMTLMCNDGKTTLYGAVNISCSIHLSIGKFDPGYFIWYKVRNIVNWNADVGVYTNRRWKSGRVFEFGFLSDSDAK